ncbi:hypothetical protein CC99x_002685 [Candidatus Berkiella cookevillensis]|uniref:Chromosome partition protein Smc n=1 Tax=Candidatus Berkiella cookevillensis TaxID=437022 RepID=A0A0Q9YDJ0_9GAMM|nr:RhoGAP domain-containing protein [Candidatus Berkiella cookevillensis]MCS5707804.1 hypothetical protein [Candidatus Berkiella cookevillensis]
MAARGPHDLSNNEILHMVRDIIGQIENNEELLNIRGILRVAGSHDAAQTILETGKVPPITSENIHTIVDVLKRSLSLMTTRIPSIDTTGLATLQAIAANVSDQETSKIALANAFQDFVDNLARSNDIDKESLGEILHNYMHLGKVISQYEATNKMTTNNCAIVIGPRMNEVLNLVPIPAAGDPALVMSAAAKASLVNDAIRIGIESGNYDVHFDQKYAEVKFNSRQRMITAVESQTEKTGASLEKLMTLLEKITGEIKQTERSLDTLKNQKDQLKGRGGLLHKKTPEEKKFLAQTRAALLREQEHYKSLSERLDALHRDIEDFEKSRIKFDHTRSELTASMRRLEHYLPSSPSTTDSDTTVSDDEFAMIENTERAFMPSVGVTTTTTAIVPDPDKERELSSEDRSPPRTPRSSQ